MRGNSVDFFVVSRGYNVDWRRGHIGLERGRYSEIVRRRALRDNLMDLPSVIYPHILHSTMLIVHHKTVLTYLIYKNLNNKS